MLTGEYLAKNYIELSRLSHRPNIEYLPCLNFVCRSASFEAHDHAKCSLLRVPNTTFRHLHTLLRHHRSWPPAIRRNFTGDTRLRSFGTATGPRGTQPAFELGIGEVDNLIDKEVESLCDVIETFLKSPEPPTWSPPSYATPSNHEFLRNLRIPSYLNGSPSLLFHDLAVCDNEIEEIFGQRRHVFICNTSGSGKTRRMLEGLTKYWGFYFVATPDPARVGIPDLSDALVKLTWDPQWVSDLHGVPLNERPFQNDLNSQIASKEFRKVLAARIVVFKLFLRLAIKVDGELLEKHKRIWLLFQSALPILKQTRHPFISIINKCLHDASPKAIDILIDRLNDIRDKYLPRSNFILGLDEAQRAARSYPYSFISSSDSDQYRSVIRVLAQVFTVSVSGVDLVISGTGLSLEELREVLASGVSKEDVFVFHHLGMFDTWDKLKRFFERYVPPSFLKTPSGYHLEKRIREYLLGRYRFSVSFLEYLLKTGLESPHMLLNEFIKRHTGCFPADCGEPFTRNEPDLRMDINVRGFDWDRFGGDLNACQRTANIVQSHLTVGVTPTFGPVSDRVVEYGIARLRDGHKGHIIEPLAFLSVMRWLETRGLGLKSNLYLRLGTQVSHGDAFEELVALYLLRILQHPIPLSTIFNFHGVRPEWADEPARVIARLEGINVPVGVHGETTENPGLGVVQYAGSIQDILGWIENPDTAPAILVPNKLFGPDLMIRFKLANPDIPIIAMGQLESCATGNKESLDAETTIEALTSLHEDHYFKGLLSEERQKLIDAIGRHPVLRFVGGYPLPPNLNLKAKSVARAIKRFGSNSPLATLNVDTFRASFISEKETENLLAPLEHALALKRRSTSPRKPKRKPKAVR